jgi:hypothetical protein
MDNIIKKENLVVLKGQSNFVIRETDTTFEANKHYRCIDVTEGSQRELLVYGVKFDINLFNDMFEYLHDRMMREFKILGLLKDGKPLSKTAFKERMDVHQYGRGQRKLFKGIFGGKMNGMIVFDCYFQGDTKANFISTAYNDYKDIINGNMTSVDDGQVERGDSGIPIAYGSIYFRKQYNPDNKDLAIYY